MGAGSGRGTPAGLRARMESATLMWIWLLAPALAGPPSLSLPPGEAAAAWKDPLELAGVTLVPRGGTARLTDEGARWTLCVDRAAGPDCSTVTPPKSAADREELAWLVAALSRELSFSFTVPATMPATMPATVPATVPEPVPEPVSAAVSEPVTPLPVTVAAKPPAPTQARVDTPEPPKAVVTPVARNASPRPAPAPKPAVRVVPAPSPPVVVAPSAPVAIAPSARTVPSEASTISDESEPSASPVVAVVAGTDSPPAVVEVVASTSEPVTPPPSPAPAPEPSTPLSPAATPAARPLPPPARRRVQQQVMLGARMQNAEGGTAYLGAGAGLEGATWMGSAAVTLDSPRSLSADGSRQTWSGCAELWGLWFPEHVGIGASVGAEHQRWWEDSRPVSAGWRPVVDARGLWCPGSDRQLCGSVAVGTSLRVVREFEGDSAPEIAVPVHVTAGVMMRRSASRRGG